MNTPRSTKQFLLLLLALACARPDSLWACAACFGNPNSSLTQGMNMAIFALLGVTGAVLATFATCIIILIVRARRHAARVAHNESTTMEGSASV